MLHCGGRQITENASFYIPFLELFYKIVDMNIFKFVKGFSIIQMGWDQLTLDLASVRTYWTWTWTLLPIEADMEMAGWDGAGEVKEITHHYRRNGRHLDLETYFHSAFFSIGDVVLYVCTVSFNTQVPFLYSFFLYANHTGLKWAESSTRNDKGYLYNGIF